jgi:hypothetical protein
MKYPSFQIQPMTPELQKAIQAVVGIETTRTVFHLRKWASAKKAGDEESAQYHRSALAKIGRSASDFLGEISDPPALFDTPHRACQTMISRPPR